MTENQVFLDMYVQDDGVGPALRILRLFKDWDDTEEPGILCAEVAKVDSEVDQNDEYINTHTISVDSLTDVRKNYFRNSRRY